MQPSPGRPWEGTEAPLGFLLTSPFLPPAALDRLQETKQQRQEGLGPRGLSPSWHVALVPAARGVRTGAQLWTELLPVRGSLLRLSSASGSLEQHQALGLCRPQFQGAYLGPGRPGSWSLLFCLLVRCQLPSATCVQLAHQTVYSGRSTAPSSEDSLGQNWRQSLDLSAREKPQTTLCRHGYPLTPRT